MDVLDLDSSIELQLRSLAAASASAGRLVLCYAAKSDERCERETFSPHPSKRGITLYLLEHEHAGKG